MINLRKWNRSLTNKFKITKHLFYDVFFFKNTYHSKKRRLLKKKPLKSTLLSREFVTYKYISNNHTHLNFLQQVSKTGTQALLPITSNSVKYLTESTTKNHVRHLCSFLEVNRLLFCTSVFSKCYLVEHSDGVSQILLPSGTQFFNTHSYQTLLYVKGFCVVNTRHNHLINTKVRGVAKNPVDHPNGGRSNTKGSFKNPWGCIAKYSK